MAIELSKKQSLAWKYLEDKITREILFGGAAGPGKTFVGCLWHIYRRTKYPKSRGLIGRNELKTLEQSTLVTFFNTCNALGYTPGKEYRYNQNKNLILWANGSVTVLKELKFQPSDPNFTTLGSTEYTDVFIDEGTEITLKAFEIINSRIRYKLDVFCEHCGIEGNEGHKPEWICKGCKKQTKGLIAKIMITCNPSPGWVKERFVKEDNLPVVLKSYQVFIPAYLTDNPSPSFIANYKQQLDAMTNDYDKLRLIHGDWDAEPKPENPFFTQFNPAKHQSEKAVFVPGRQITFTVDFNINPFSINMSHIWRDEEGIHAHIFDELNIEAGSIPKLCDELELRYGRWKHIWRFTGDAMGKNRQINQRDHSSHYTQMRSLLKLSANQFYLPSNPTHENSREDVNYFLMHFPDFKVNPLTCPDTCRDLKVVQCDAFGSIIKKNRHQLDQRADQGDNVRYLVNTFMKKQWIIPHQKVLKQPPGEIRPIIKNPTLPEVPFRAV